MGRPSGPMIRIPLSRNLEQNQEGKKSYPEEEEQDEEETEGAVVHRGGNLEISGREGLRERLWLLVGEDVVVSHGVAQQ